MRALAVDLGFEVFKANDLLLHDYDIIALQDMVGMSQNGVNRLHNRG
jgi:hypothetical protein